MAVIGAGATATLLLLADGRLPTGGHVHSGGVEEAVTDGRVSDLAGLEGYVVGRLWTTGLVDAAQAAVAWTVADGDGRCPDRWADLDAEAAARTPAPALRKAARSQGRGLLRAAGRLWPSPVLDALGATRRDGPFWAVVLGAAARVAGVDAPGAALIAAQASVSGPAWAAVRLLGLDPFAVAGLAARLAPSVDEVAAAGLAEGRPAPGRRIDLSLLPARSSGPLTDVAAEAHACREVRLFAS